MRISDWSSDVFSSDLGDDRRGSGTGLAGGINAHRKALAYVTSLRQPDHKGGHVECRGGASLRDGRRAADGGEEAGRANIVRVGRTGSRRLGRKTKIDVVGDARRDVGAEPLKDKIRRHSAGKGQQVSGQR